MFFCQYVITFKRSGAPSGPGYPLERPAASSFNLIFKSGCNIIVPLNRFKIPLCNIFICPKDRFRKAQLYEI